MFSRCLRWQLSVIYLHTKHPGLYGKILIPGSMKKSKIFYLVQIFKQRRRRTRRIMIAWWPAAFVTDGFAAGEEFSGNRAQNFIHFEIRVCECKVFSGFFSYQIVYLSPKRVLKASTKSLGTFRVGFHLNWGKPVADIFYLLRIRLANLHWMSNISSVQKAHIW